MSFSSSDFKLYKPTTQAANFATATIGGAKTSTQASAANISEICFLMPVDPVSALTQYAKAFLGNSNATDSPTAVKVWLKNALDDWGAFTTTGAAKGDASGDDNGKFVRFLGHNSTGDPVALDVNLSGATVVGTGDNLTKLQSVELRDQSTGALVAAVKDVTIYRNATILGVIPAGAYTATSEFDIWLPATLNDSTTAATAASAPSGSSFTRPRTEAAGLSVANAGVLTATAAQGVWYKWTLPANTKSRGDIQVVLGIRWNDPV